MLARNCALLFVLATVAAEQAPGIKGPLLQQALELSGCDQQMRQTFAIVYALIDQPLAAREREIGYSDSDLQQIRSLLKSTLNADALYVKWKGALEMRIDDRSLTGVVRWYGLPLGRRIVALEGRAGTSVGIAEAQNYAATLRKSPPTRQRLQLARQYEEVTNFTDLTQWFSAGMLRSLAKGLAAAASSKFPSAYFDSLANKAEADGGVAVREGSTATVRHIYRSLTDEEFKQYITFLASPEGKRFTADGTSAFKEIMDGALEQLGRKIGRI